MDKKEIKFGVDGWRDVIADGFTYQNVKVASRGIGKFVLKNCNKNLPVLIGYDPRFLAEIFAKTCAAELLNLGLNILLSKYIIPTPVIAYLAAKLKTNGAIQFTASHNPPIYCGLKYITNYGGPAPVDITNKIIEYIRETQLEAREQLTKDSPPPITHGFPTFDLNKEYFAHIKKLINFDIIQKANLKVVYDPMYGAGINFLDRLLKDANCKTIIIHSKKDPLFGGLMPDPKEKFLKDLKENVISNKANIGLATDGDGDRLSAIDKAGNFYSANKIAPMLLRHLVKNKKQKGIVVRTLATTHLLDHLAKKYNLNLIETKVGFKWICEEMRKNDVLIGVEESGGISILNHIPDKDGILTGMLLVEMLAIENKTLAQIYKETLEDANWFCINDSIDLDFNDKRTNNLISNLKSKETKQLKDLKIQSINTKEGAKCLLEDGSWFMVRPSGTEPKTRVYFEATSDKVLKLMRNYIQKIIRKN